VRVPASLKLDRRADLLHREACRDGHAELAYRDQAGNLLDGAGGGVSAVRRGDPVDLRGDSGDPLVRQAKFPRHLHCLRPVQVDRRSDAGGSQGTDPAGQAVAMGDRLGPESTAGTGRGRRSRPDHSCAREAGELDGEHADPASCAADEQRVARARVDDGEGGRGRAPRYGKGGGGAVVDSTGGTVRVAGRERRHAVTDLAGLLTLGSYPQEFFPQLNITFVVFPSDQAGVVPDGGPRFIDNRSLNGPVPWVVSDAVDAITRNMRLTGTVRGVGRQDVYEYPVEALREAIVNAIMHRDYSPPSRGAQVQVEMYPSRLVVRNPGGLFRPVAEGELGAEGVTSSRNPVLSALLQEVQLPDSDRVICENRGTGIPTMLEQLRRSGTASVKFSNAISHFTVTFTRDAPSSDEFRTGRDLSHTGGDLAGRPAEILGLFTGQQDLTASDIAQATGLSKAMTNRHLARLVTEGRLIATAPPASRYRAYRLPPNAP
jgi:hypothetical protein